MDQERNLRPLDCQEVKTMFFSCQKHQRGNKDASTWSIPIWWPFSDERWDREWLMSSVHAEEQKKREPNRTCWELSDSSVLLEYSPIGSGSPSFVSAALIRALNFWVKLSSLFKTKKKKKTQLKVAAVLLGTFLQWHDTCDLQSLEAAACDEKRRISRMRGHIDFLIFPLLNLLLANGSKKAFVCLPVCLSS